MSQFELARDIATTYFSENFKQAGGADWFPVEYPNRHLQEEPSGAPWGRFSFNEGMKIGRDVGNGVARIPGEVVLQIFLPDDSGTKLARQAADQIANFIENVFVVVPPDGVIRFRMVSMNVIGRSEAWFQINVVVPFDRDVTNPIPPPVPVVVVP